MSESWSRKHLSAEGLRREARRVFAQVPDAPGHDIPLVVERDRQETTTRANIQALCGVSRAASLKDPNFDLEVDFLGYWEQAPDGTVTHFARVTGIPMEPTNLMTLMRGARARGRIENETFNTLKNQSYHFEHHFGHGHQHLSTVLMHLMMLAFLIDQIQQRGCRPVPGAVSAAKRKTRFRRTLRTRFDLCLVPDWETLYRSIITPPSLPLGADTA